MESVCKSCQSSRVLTGADVLAIGFFLGPKAVILQGPAASWKGHVQVKAVADVCIDCGDVRLRVRNPEKLEQVYAQTAGDPELRLNL